MMQDFTFSKIHGAGNDFVVTEENNKNLSKPDFITRICDRKRGIGADGLIILTQSDKKNQTLPCFKMNYYNCDGGKAEMCGNGLRCAAYYANKYLKSEGDSIIFETGAGKLETNLLGNNQVKIEIPLISPPEKLELDNKETYKVNTGVPHLIVPVDNINDIDVYTLGKYFRYHESFKPDGTNVNFICMSENKKYINIRTYERGVENETAACGTGIAAAAAAMAKYKGLKSPISFLTRDNDNITIDFCANDHIVDGVKEIKLTGPVEEVFRGKYLA